MGVYKIPRIIGINKKPSFGAMINWHHSLSQGLVGAWLLNEYGGLKTFDQFDNNGIFSGWSGVPSWSSGIGLNVSGTNYVDCGTSSKFDFDTKDFTIATRILKIANPVQVGGIVSKGVGTNPSYGLRIINTGAAQMLIVGSSTIGATSAVLSNNVWYSLVGRFIANVESRTYIDGKQSGYDSAVGITLGSIATSLKIGSQSPTQWGFNGLVEYVYIYNRALSATEIVTLYADPYQMFLRPVWDAYIIPSAAPPPTGGKSIFGYDSIFHAGGIIQT